MRKFYTEAAYFAGLAFLAFGTALMEAANFGVSMIVAPAYLFYLKLSPVFPFFTFGMAEYTLQTVLIIALGLVMKRFKVSYLFSFVTAVIYGLMLDGFMLLTAMFPATTALRIAFYILGMILCAIGVSLLFHTYIAPEAYELFVKELSAKTGSDIHRVKTIYDCISCAVGVLLSFLFFGLWHFEGVKLGTIFCALINGWLISLCSAFLEKHFVFEDRLPLREKFMA